MPWACAGRETCCLRDLGRHGAPVALARAIALDPELVMYDEPFAG